MKIAVAIPSYKNPSGLIAGVRNLYDLADNPNNLSFRIGLDKGDIESFAVLKYLPTNPTVVWFDEHTIHSSMAGMLCDAEKADYYLLHADDLVCITPRWDLIVAKSGVDNPVMFWNDVNNPRAAGSCILRHDWLSACGYAMPPYFPFWFGDTWVDELRAFVTGYDLGIVPQLKLYVPYGKTTGMQELDFWWGFFNATRPLRLREAYKIFTAIYKEELNHGQFHERAKDLGRVMRQRDREHRLRIPNIEKFFIDEMSDKKTLRHQRCKKIALELMASENLKLWGDL